MARWPGSVCLSNSGLQCYRAYMPVAHNYILQPIYHAQSFHIGFSSLCFTVISFIWLWTHGTRQEKVTYWFHKTLMLSVYLIVSTTILSSKLQRTSYFFLLWGSFLYLLSAWQLLPFPTHTGSLISRSRTAYPLSPFSNSSSVLTTFPRSLSCSGNFLLFNLCPNSITALLLCLFSQLVSWRLIYNYILQWIISLDFSIYHSLASTPTAPLKFSNRNLSKHLGSLFLICHGLPMVPNHSGHSLLSWLLWHHYPSSSSWIVDHSFNTPSTGAVLYAWQLNGYFPASLITRQILVGPRHWT